MVKRLYILLIGILLAQIVVAQNINGIVLDDASGEPIPYASIHYKGHEVGMTTDLDGNFTIERHEGWTLYISCIGYTEQQIAIDSQTPMSMTIKMKEDTKLLTEIVVKSKRHRYSRKNNPAVELMKKVVAARTANSLEKYDYFQYNKYQKISLALNDYKKANSDSILSDKFKWNEHTEKSPYNNKTILPLSVDETVKQYVYRKNPRTEKNIIQGVSSTGINQLMMTGDIVNTMLKEVFQDVDINNDYVRLLQYPFPSPIGSHAVGFYHFYIEDTVKVDRDECIHLRFFPNNQQDFGFNGDLYVMNDSSLQVKRCDLTLPKKSDVNYVTDMHISQVFSLLDNGEWALTEDDMWAEMTVLKQNMLVVRNTRLTDYAFDELPKGLFRGKAKEMSVANARNRDDDFWNEFRRVELSEKEKSVSSFIDQLKQHKGMKVPLFLIKCLVENYIETSSNDKPSKFDFGPVISTFSSNFVDGFRTRLSGRTMGALNPHWFWKGYYAHGYKSGKNYYSSTVTFSFNKKNNSPFEFPQRCLSFESTYDVMSPSDKFLINDKDNMIVGIKTEKIDQMYFYNRQKLSFVYETDYGLNLSADIKTESNRVAGNLHFIHVNNGVVEESFRTTECSVGLTYTPGQTYINTKQRRYPINFDNPSLSVRHTVGMKGFLGGQYGMNLTELDVYKRQWLGSYGHIDVHIDAAAQWNKLPFPLLMTPPIDLSYIEQEGTFNMLHNMELFMDRKVFWSVAWDMNGKLFNRIPLLKKLKFREYVAFKGIWGKLTDKNNPACNPDDETLFILPKGSYAIDSHRPYMEVVAGIHNILKFFSIEWVHRLAYNDHPATKKNGVRFGLQVSF